MKILVACEESQAVTKELRALGHEAYSCDIIPCSGGHPEWHLQQDVLYIMNETINLMVENQLGDGIIIPDKWDMIIGFPPCTHLAVSGSRHFEGKREDGRQREAIEFFMEIINADCDKIAIENPIGIISGEYIGKHFSDLKEKHGFPIKSTQRIQPFEFGDPVKKTTCLWLKGLPQLVGTNNVESDVLYYTSPNTGKKMSDWNARQLVINGKKYGYNTPEFKKHRSKTFAGIAEAMAKQWGGNND